MKRTASLLVLAFTATIGLAAQSTPASLPAASANLPAIHDLLVLSDKVDSAAAKALGMYEWVEMSVTEGSHNRIDVPAETECRFGYSVQNVGVRRLLMKNGTAVSAKEMAINDGEVARIVRDGFKRKGPAQAAHSTAQGAILERVGNFHNMHRMTYRGRPSIMVSFEGDANRKASGLEEKLARALSGTLIFDEAEGALASSDMSLTQTFSYLVMTKLKKGARSIQTKTRTPEGIWLPLFSSDAFQGKIFFNSVSLVDEQYHSDYVFTGTHLTDIYAGKTLERYPLHVQNALKALLQKANGPQDDPDADEPAP